MMAINMQFPDEKFINQIVMCLLESRKECIKYARVYVCVRSIRQSFINQIRWRIASPNKTRRIFN